MKTTLSNIVAVLSIVVLMFLYHKTQLVDTEQHNQILDTMAELKQLDALWIDQVLHSRLALNNNYDALAATLIALEKTKERWQAFKLSAIYGENLAQAEQQKIAYLAQLAEKREYIEQFKSVHAILSNSIRYFPTAVTELMALNTTHATIDAANELLAAVLKYSLLPEKDTEIQPLIVALHTTGVAYAPQDVREQIDIINSHARSILKYKPDINVLLKQITMLSTAKKINALTHTYVALQDARLQESSPYRKALVLFSAILLLFIAFIGYRLRLSYKALDIANQQLQTANETLEERVKERTRELSNTLKQLKESQTQLIQSEKMASLGQMVAGLVHEINTPLGYVKSNVQLIQSMFKPDEDLEELLNDSLHGLEQISELVNNLKNFSRLDLASVSNVDLHECLNNSLLIAKHLFKNRITINKLYGNIPQVKCSPSQINQVFLNLLTNAVQAIEKRGTISITTRVKNDRVNVVIQDNGKGIPETVRPKIFDPFFTTKNIGDGTGMGLSISYKIIKEHGGDIEVTSQEGSGTTFIVSLPIEDNQ